MANDPINQPRPEAVPNMNEIDENLPGIDDLELVYERAESALQALYVAEQAAAPGYVTYVDTSTQ